MLIEVLSGELPTVSQPASPINKTISANATIARIFSPFLSLIA
jgi:hypothetical protein